MKFFKGWDKLRYPTFTTIRQNKGYYKEGQIINVITPDDEFYAEIVSIIHITKDDITDTMAFRDAGCSKKSLKNLMDKFYREKSNDLILITLMKEKPCR